MEKKKILIIDDEKSFTHLVKLNLEETGRFEVRAENQGKNGLATARAFKPDLILLDVLMPDILGDDVAYDIRNDPELKTIPIVFLTAAATKEEISKCCEIVNGFPYYTKPIDARELIDCIDNILK